ncbi:hypothetical protein [Streptomyces sp. NPDC008125]|uniref:hypothetical protein n=1 Tax=Streptomyces sp. NPDC008125 TaxID=3364811 RepID=UPI0036E62285
MTVESEVSGVDLARKALTAVGWEEVTQVVWPVPPVGPPPLLQGVLCSPLKRGAAITGREDCILATLSEDQVGL